MNVLLLNHPVKQVLEAEAFQTINDAAGRYLPLGLLALATYLRRVAPEHTVRVVDCVLEDIDYPALAAELTAFRPAVVGITTYLHSLRDLRRTLAMIRQLLPESAICLGGANTRHYAEEMLAYPEVNAVIRGDGEQAFAAYVACRHDDRPPHDIRGLLFKEGELIRRGGDPDESLSLGVVPVIDRTLVDYRRSYSSLSPSKRFTTLFRSRGCPYRCGFCMVTEKRLRVRPVEHVIAEIRDCHDRLGLDSFMFMDDVFNCGGESLRAFLAELRDVFHGRIHWSARVTVAHLDDNLLRLMRDSGCYLLHLGIETGSDEGLLRIGKRITVAQCRDAVHRCHRHGIQTLAYYMLGLPHERSCDDVRHNLRTAVGLGCTYAFFTVYTPYPFSPFFDEGEAKGICSYAQWRAYVRDPGQPFTIRVWDEFLSRDTLFRLLREAYLAFYLRPRTILRVLRALRRPHEIVQLLRTFAGVLHGT